MALSAFDDKAAPPDETALAVTLGPAHELWNTVRGRLAAAWQPYAEVWGYTSKSTGWGLRVKHGERVIVYLTPQHGEFLASFALGEAAVRDARQRGLPAAVLELIDGARKYAEGRAVRFTVATAADLDVVEKLAAAKAGLPR
jgi:hypothetical protein